MKVVNFLAFKTFCFLFNLRVTYEELINSGNWYKGWINLPKLQSITEEYIDYKSSKKEEGIDEIFINEDSLFNIS